MMHADLAPPPPLDARRAALFLDLDGTLAPIEPRPEAVTPDERRNAVLADCTRALDGRLAVISGRALADVDRILARTVAPVAAVHGLVTRTEDGELVREPGHPGLAEAAKAVRAFAHRHPGMLVEDKDVSVALHFRQAPDMAGAAHKLARELSQTLGLVVQAGDMVVELRSPGPDKGDALRTFMERPVFAGALPIFVGDDLTDEAGFSAAAALGGYGVIVGGRASPSARYRLADVDAVLGWLSGATR